MYRINNSDFAILAKYKLFLNTLDNILENIPRKDMYYKDKIRDISIGVLENILWASYETNPDTIKSIGIQIKKGISTLDYMMDRLFDKHYVAEKPLFKLGSYLTEVNKMLSSWIENMVNGESKIK